MIAILQWTTLAVCGAVTMARIPSALRGENRSLFSIFALATVAILLEHRWPLLVVDRVLGGAEHRQPGAPLCHFRRPSSSLASGGPGLRRGRRPAAHHRPHRHRGGGGGLGGRGGGVPADGYLGLLRGAESPCTPRTTAMPALVEYYGAAGRLYPAFVTAGPVAGHAADAAQQAPGLLRCSAALMALGTAAIALSLLVPGHPAAPGISGIRHQLRSGPVPHPGANPDLAGEGACAAGSEAASCPHQIVRVLSNRVVLKKMRKKQG